MSIRNFDAEKISKALTKVSSLLLGGILLISCSSDGNDNYKGQADNTASQAATEAPAKKDEGKGVGPVTTVSLGDGIDEQLALKGKEAFESKCSACHQMSNEKVVGPGLAGITKRRKPEWVMNMIVNPEEMTKKDPVAKRLLAEHLIQMTNQNVNEEDARAMLEYFRQNDTSI